MAARKPKSGGTTRTGWTNRLRDVQKSLSWERDKENPNPRYIADLEGELPVIEEHLAKITYLEKNDLLDPEPGNEVTSLSPAEERRRESTRESRERYKAKQAAKQAELEARRAENSVTIHQTPVGEAVELDGQLIVRAPRFTPGSAIATQAEREGWLKPHHVFGYTYHGPLLEETP